MILVAAKIPSSMLSGVCPRMRHSDLSSLGSGHTLLLEMIFFSLHQKQPCLLNRWENSNCDNKAYGLEHR